MVWQCWGLYHRGACDPLASEAGSGPAWRGPCHSPAGPAWWAPSAAAAAERACKTRGRPAQRSTRHRGALWGTGDAGHRSLLMWCLAVSFCALSCLHVATTIKLLKNTFETHSRLSIPAYVSRYQHIILLLALSLISLPAFKGFSLIKLSLKSCCIIRVW